jgi:hypothetical protein
MSYEFIYKFFCSYHPIAIDKITQRLSTHKAKFVSLDPHALACMDWSILLVTEPVVMHRLLGSIVT